MLLFEHLQLFTQFLLYLTCRTLANNFKLHKIIEEALLLLISYAFITNFPATRTDAQSHCWPIACEKFQLTDSEHMWSKCVEFPTPTVMLLWLLYVVWMGRRRPLFLSTFLRDYTAQYSEGVMHSLHDNYIALVVASPWNFCSFTNFMNMCDFGDWGVKWKNSQRRCFAITLTLAIFTNFENILKCLLYI